MTLQAGLVKRMWQRRYCLSSIHVAIRNMRMHLCFELEARLSKKAAEMHALFSLFHFATGASVVNAEDTTGTHDGGCVPLNGWEAPHG